jgi:hypothetical protein
MTLRAAPTILGLALVSVAWWGAACGPTGLPAGAYHELIGDAAVTAPLSVPPRSAAILVPQ